MQDRIDSNMQPRIKSHILHFTALGKYFDSLIHNIIFSRIELTTSLDVYSKALKILQTIFERLSDLAREFLAARFIEDTVS